MPHYERMLYDNAGLLAVAEPGQARGIADFLRDTLRRDDGAFVAAQDSESTMDGQRVEGAWYRQPLDERGRFAPPPLDDQVLTGWNGLAIRGLVIAGARHGDAEMIALARGAADAIVAGHVRDGHVTVRSSTPREPRAHRRRSRTWASWPRGCSSSPGHRRRRVRPGRTLPGGRRPRGTLRVDPVLAAAGTVTGEQPQTALRSGTVALAAAAAVLAALTGDAGYREAAAVLVADRAHTGTERPLGHADALGVALALQRPSREVVVVAPVDDPMRAAAVAARRPGTVVGTVTGEQAAAWTAAGFELFAGRDLPGAAAYVCHDRVCGLPARSAADLAAQLAAGATG